MSRFGEFNPSGGPVGKFSSSEGAFGEFTLQKDLGRSAFADRYQALHASQGGPFFLKVYRRLRKEDAPKLLARADAAIARVHPSLVRHLGHGVVDGVPFVVSPLLSGLDLPSFVQSLRERRVVLGFDAALLILREVALAVGALFSQGQPGLPHGDVSLGHVRLGEKGEVWLTGHVTPREGSEAADARFDVAGVGALLYDLAPVLHAGRERQPMSSVVDRTLRRLLAVGKRPEFPEPQTATLLIEQLAHELSLKLDRKNLADAVRRTIEALAPAQDDDVNVHSAATVSVHAVVLEPTPAVQPKRVPAHVPSLPTLEPVPGPTMRIERPPPVSLGPTDASALSAPTPPIVRTPARPTPLVRAEPEERRRTPLLADPVVSEGPSLPIRHLPPDRVPPDKTQSGPMIRPSFGEGEVTEVSPPTTSSDARSTRVDASRDATDPVQRGIRTDAARRDPAVLALLAHRVVNELAVNTAIAEHVQRGGRVIEILVANGAASDDAVAQTLAGAAGHNRLSDDDLLRRRPTPQLARRIPQTYLLARRVLPLELVDGRLVVAVADPFETGTLDELKALLGAHRVDVFVCARASLTRTTVEVYRSLGLTTGQMQHAPTVLVVTPDVDKAARIGGRLVQEGMRVEHVEDPVAALEIIRSRAPACVLAAHVKGTSSHELLLAVRQDPNSEELPFFVMGPKDDDIATRQLDLGADDYFNEPVRMDLVVAKVRRAVGKGVRGQSGEGSPLGDRSGIFPNSSNQPKALPASPFSGPFDDALSGLDDLPELPPDLHDSGDDDPVAAMPTGVMGTLRQMPVPEIVQSLEMGRKTARVDLVPTDGDKGMIAFDHGQVRYAECGALRGPDAFFQLVRHKEGFFRIHYGDAPPAHNIDAPTTFLLLEAMRLMDEEGLH